MREASGKTCVSWLTGLRSKGGLGGYSHPPPHIYGKQALHWTCNRHCDILHAQRQATLIRTFSSDTCKLPTSYFQQLQPSSFHFSAPKLISKRRNGKLNVPGGACPQTPLGILGHPLLLTGQPPNPKYAPVTNPVEQPRFWITNFICCTSSCIYILCNYTCWDRYIRSCNYQGQIQGGCGQG